MPHSVFFAFPRDVLNHDANDLHVAYSKKSHKGDRAQ
jgi:hypothetical protein